MANTKITADNLAANAVTASSIADNSIGITQLNVSDGTNGQVLTTNGSGTLSFSTISGYTDSDVETYLDTGTSTPTFASATVSGTFTVNTDANSTLTIADGGSDAITLYGGTGDELYIGANNAYSLRFKTTGDIVMDNGGSLGIGTSSTSSKLTLLNNTPDGTTDIRQYATFGPTASWLDSDTVGWAGAGIGEVQIHNGTASRPPVLSLGGSLAAGELLGAVNFFRSSNTDTYRQRAYIASGLSSSGTADQYGADLRFATAADGATSPSTRMTITSSGDITIGSQKTLWSGAYGGALEIKGDNATSDRYIRLKTVDSTGSDINGFLTLKYNKVGINISSPSSFLSVFGDGDSTTGHALNLGAGNSSTNFNAAQIIFSYDGGQHDSYGYSHNIRSRHHSGQARNNALDFYLWRYGTDGDTTLGSLRVMELECTGSNGELKVGTQVLTETYNPLVGGVTSDALITGRHATQGSLGLWRTNTMEFKYYHNGQGYIMTFGSNGVISGDFNDTSDRNLKENIVDLEGGLSVITQLRPRNFDWKKEAKANGVAGFIAQEVEEILPNEVFGNDYVETESDLPEDVPPDNGKHLNYNGILAHAVKAIQEQQTIIDDLKARIETLENA